MASTKANLSARKQWEERQQRLHGCKYIDGVCCVEHGSQRIASDPKSLCTCRLFSHPHEPEEHDTLPGRFAGDTELKRYEDAAATDWRTREERQPQGEQLLLIEKSTKHR
jgi:hypothetical protein